LALDPLSKGGICFRQPVITFLCLMKSVPSCVACLKQGPRRWTVSRLLGLCSRRWLIPSLDSLRSSSRGRLWRLSGQGPKIQTKARTSRKVIVHHADGRRRLVLLDKFPMGSGSDGRYRVTFLSGWRPTEARNVSHLRGQEMCQVASRAFGSDPCVIVSLFKWVADYLNVASSN
jgi:hypothetical protein